MLQMLESLNLVLVVGLSVDYVVHLAEGYSRSAHNDRLGRTRDALEEVGISVLSGAATTLGASMFLLFAQILFFTEFGVFMFSTILFSILYALGFFITLIALIGPQNEFGSLKPFYRWCAKKCGCNKSSN
jgi:predicted RND superfamily exporter protein